MATTLPLHTEDPLQRALRAYGFESTHDCIFPAPQRYPSRVALFQQDDEPDGVFLLREGLVKLMRLDHDGRETIVGLRASGWLIGASAVILNRPHTLSACTVVPSRVSWLTGEVFRTQMKRDAELSWRLHEMQSEEVYSAQHHVADLHGHCARTRLETFLRRLAGTLRSPAAEKEVRLTIPLRQWEIAQLIGVTAPYLNELIREMESEGRLRRERNTIVLNAEWSPNA